MPAENPWVSLIGMLAVVAVVIGLAYWFTRYVVGGSQWNGVGMLQRNEHLRILAQTQVGKEQRIVVLQAGERWFLVGITPQNISPLAELSKEEADLWRQGHNNGGNIRESTFKQAFMETLQKRKQR